MGVNCTFRGVRETEAYNILLGGALGANPQFAEVTLRKVPAEFIQHSIRNIVEAYKANRIDSDETFRQFLSRHTPEQLSAWLTIPEMAEVK